MEALSTAAYQLDRSLETPHLSPPHLILELEHQPETALLLNDREGAIAPDADASLAAQTSRSTDKETKQQFWSVFSSTFITIFLAELGDKTQVATLLMTAESHAPWIVFTGAAAALISTSLLGVLLGHWLSSRVSAKTLDTAAGITLAILSVWLLWDALQ